MKTTSTVTATFCCPLDRAFKTPILGDATKILTGYALIPATTHFTDDETWGKIGGHRIPHSSKNWLSKGGAVGIDTVLDRQENKYWKWAVTDFKQWSMGFTMFRGELFFSDNNNGTVAVKWVYTLFSENVFAYPFHWLFTKILWKGQMQVGIKNMKHLAETQAAYIYS